MCMVLFADWPKSLEGMDTKPFIYYIYFFLNIKKQVIEYTGLYIILYRYLYRKMYISNISIKLFKEILEYISLRNASEIMLVNNREYRAIIYNQCNAKFKELLYS